MSPDNKIAINSSQLSQTTILGSSTALLIAYSNSITNLRDFLLTFLILNNNAFKLLKTLDLAKKLFNNLGSIYYN